MRTLLCCGALAATALLACSDDADPAGADAGSHADTDAAETDAETDAGPTYDDGACSAFAVPTAFGMRWANANHRISLWEVRLDADDTRCGADALRATYVGGDWTTGEAETDAPSLAATVAHVGADPATVGASRESVTFELVATDEATQTLTVDRELAGLLGYPAVDAVLSGLRYETDVPQGDSYPDDYEPRFGYTSRGIGAGVDVVSVDAETITLEVRARFAHGPSDREDMNRAMVHATTRVVVDVLVLGTQAPAVSGSVDYELSYPKQLIGEDPALAHASEEQQAVALSGAPDAERGFVALRAFDMELFTDGTCSIPADCPRGDTCDAGVCSETYGPAGVYVRELSVGATLDSYDAATGEARASVDGFASNSSKAFAFFAMRHRFHADVAWLQLPTAAPTTIAETMQTGVPFVMAFD